MDGKKKKNKKKKGNSHSKFADDALANVEDNGSSPQLTHIPPVPSTTDLQSVGASESDMEIDRLKVYEERFVKLQEEVKQLEAEKNQRLQKEASLEAKIKLLENDVDSCIKKEADLEEKLKSLQSGTDFFIQKEAIFEDRLKHIEGIKDSSIVKETLINEMASRLEEVNVRLEEQVKELKESRDGFVQENTQLRESIAVMESRVQHMETEIFRPRSSTIMTTEQSPIEKVSQYQPETAAMPLVEKQKPEKFENIEKVKEVHIELDHHYSTHGLDHVKRPIDSDISIDYTPEHNKEIYESNEAILSSPEAHNPFGIVASVENFSSLNGMENPRISEDIVSVPLDDIHVQEMVPEKTEVEENELPLSDAPLIGAPFRLFSFVAKYVSGADLVDKDGARSG